MVFSTVIYHKAILGDWHTCAMPLRAPPRWKVEERAEWDAWVASEVRGDGIRGGGGAIMLISDLGGG